MKSLILGSALAVGVGLAASAPAHPLQLVALDGTTSWYLIRDSVRPGDEPRSFSFWLNGNTSSKATVVVRYNVKVSCTGSWYIPLRTVYRQSTGTYRSDFKGDLPANHQPLGLNALMKSAATWVCS